MFFIFLIVFLSLSLSLPPSPSPSPSPSPLPAHGGRSLCRSMSATVVDERARDVSQSRPEQARQIVSCQCSATRVCFEVTCYTNRNLGRVEHLPSGPFVGHPLLAHVTKHVQLQTSKLRKLNKLQTKRPSSPNFGSAVEVPRGKTTISTGFDRTIVGSISLLNLLEARQAATA